MVEPILNFNVPTIPFEGLLSREWLITNGLGGYASGTIAGVNTRRFHGMLIANLSAPRGRTMLVPYLSETVGEPGRTATLGGVEFSDGKIDSGAQAIVKFSLEWQMPVWIFRLGAQVFKKQVFMPYGRNCVGVMYELLEGGSSLPIQLRPYCACRTHDSALGYPQEWPFTVTCTGQRYEVAPFQSAPIIRMTLNPFQAVFVSAAHRLRHMFYRMEFRRGLDCIEDIFSPGYFAFELKRGEPVFFMAGTEPWESMEEDPREIFRKELARKRELLAPLSDEAKEHLLTTQLTLAADQFVVLPRTRNEKNIMLESVHRNGRTVIAGYHWFTDWGRDTMISLEGLTLCLGRMDEAKAILQTFAHYVKNGLLPNHFPEGQREPIYNTVDATLWYFHALDRYYSVTKDKQLLELLFPVLQSIIEAHIRGTDFGIHLDQSDHLIEASAEGFQLTWMDAKVDEWVVTPRRGKPVEIQALWFNALRLMESWSMRLKQPPEQYADLAQRAYDSFNSRFWYDAGGYLFDVVDSHSFNGNDAALRPNQIISMSLRYPILTRELWKPVVDAVESRLLTPHGLRTLTPDDKNYHGHYEGSRWERDAAYHQGLVWPWLMGAFVDAWGRVYQDPQKARQFFKPFEEHLFEAGIGSVSEIFDGDSPHIPRGCVAQAWSVAEVLRTFLKLFGQHPQDLKSIAQLKQN